MEKARHWVANVLGFVGLSILAAVLVVGVAWFLAVVVPVMVSVALRGDPAAIVWCAGVSGIALVIAAVAISPSSEKAR